MYKVKLLTQLNEIVEATFLDHDSAREYVVTTLATVSKYYVYDNNGDLIASGSGV